MRSRGPTGAGRAPVAVQANVTEPPPLLARTFATALAGTSPRQKLIPVASLEDATTMGE